MHRGVRSIIPFCRDQGRPGFRKLQDSLIGDVWQKKAIYEAQYLHKYTNGLIRCNELSQIKTYFQNPEGGSPALELKLPQVLCD